MPRRRNFLAWARFFSEVGADVLRIDVQAMLPLLNDPDDEVRLDVSAIISALSLGRQDGTTVLEPAVATLMAHFKDRVRTTKPAIPRQPSLPLESC